MRPTATELAATLGLEPHPEGGFYLETYRAAETVVTSRGVRPACTAIVFVVAAEAPSRLHRLASDELWVFQGGLPLELVTISSDGAASVQVLCDVGDVVARGPARVTSSGPPSVGLSEGPPSRATQALVPAGSWQGARLAGGPHLPAEQAWALVSCIVTPGFDFADFEIGDRDALLAAYPQHAELVRALS